MAVSQEVMKLGRSFNDQAGAPGAGPVPGSSARSSRSTGKRDDGNVIDAEFSCVFSSRNVQLMCIGILNVVKDIFLTRSKKYKINLNCENGLVYRKYILHFCSAIYVFIKIIKLV